MATAQVKPKKPHKDFPLFPHANGRWAKKVRGKLFYFGRWDDPQAALDKWLREKDYLLAGRTPPADGESNILTVADLANRFLTWKQQKVETGELTEEAFIRYRGDCQRATACWGRDFPVVDLTPDHFARLRAHMAKTLGPTTLHGSMTTIRSLFRFGQEQELITTPVRYGVGFKKPTQAVLRKHRESRGRRMFERDEIHKLLAVCNAKYRAMILLGVNCGFGPSDIGQLPVTAVDLDRLWIDFARPKTGVRRRCPLWPETAEALQQHLAQRPEHLPDRLTNLCFFSRQLTPYYRNSMRSVIVTVFRSKCMEAGVYKRYLCFYGLRRTFETVGGESRDQVAVNHIMGHAPSAFDMPALYRDRISDERLRAVADHIRDWLFSDDGNNRKKRHLPKPR